MAYKYDLSIDQGADVSLVIECQSEDGTPLVLTGYTAAAQIRYKHSDTDPAAVFVAEVDSSAGSVSLSMTASQTSGLTKSYGVWDCELTSPTGAVQRLAEGRVSISPEVTR